MKLVIFGLTISSSWGNGHATLLRALCRQLIARGHDIVFFERNVPYYAAHRDMHELPGGTLRLYGDWADALPIAQREISDADVVMVTSYCPDGIAASELVWCSSALRVFYDLDTPVTLSRLRSGEQVGYISSRGLVDFDLVLSFTGGAALTALQEELGARRVAPLFGSVDPDVHHAVEPDEQYRCSLSYLGTYAADRQQALEHFLLEPARRLPDDRFIIAGAQYPGNFPWVENVFFVQHLPPSQHPTFFCSSRLTLNITRSTMARMGWCPSGRLFEAAACGVPMITDTWAGLDEFFTPGEEILTCDTISALSLSNSELRKIASAARERTLAEHSSARRAEELETLLIHAGAAEPLPA